MSNLANDLPKAQCMDDRTSTSFATDIQLHEACQLVSRLYRSSMPEPTCPSVLPLFDPLVALGLVSVNQDQPSMCRAPCTLSRTCPPSVLLHYWWGTLIPAVYKSLENEIKSQSLKPEDSRLCTLVLQLPNKKTGISSLVVSLSPLLEEAGLGEIIHIETGDKAGLSQLQGARQ